MRSSLLVLLAVSLTGAQTDPAILAEQGKQAMAEGRFTDAARIYAGLVKQIPGNPGLLLNLGMALHMAGDDASAIPRFEQALAIAPDIYPALLFLGASHLRLSQPAKAIPPLERAAKLASDQPQPHQLLGEAHLAVGRLHDALRHQKQAVALAPDAPGAWGALVQIYDALAADALKALEQSGPESAWMLRLVADLRASQKQYPSAFYLYREALQRDPTMRGLHAGLAEIYRQTGKAEWAAIEEKREAEAKALDCAQSKLECEVARGRLDSVALARTTTLEGHFWRARASAVLAAQAFAKLDALPGSAEKFEVEARLYADQQRFAQSAAAWKQALALDPDNEFYAGELAAQLYFARQFEEARPRLEALVKREPQNGRWSFFLGDLLLQRQEVEAALPLLERAARNSPDLLTAHHALGRAYMQLGRPEEAIPELKAALEIDIDGSLHYQLAQAYIRTGKREEAAAPLAKYREMQNSQRARLEAAREMEITAPQP